LVIACEGRTHSDHNPCDHDYDRLRSLALIALTGLAISVQHRNHSRPAQTRVPSIEGLKYETAAATLRASNLKIQVLATRSDLRLEPVVIVNQIPQPGQEVDLGYIVSVTLSATDLQGPSRKTANLLLTTNVFLRSPYPPSLHSLKTHRLQ